MKGVFNKKYSFECSPGRGAFLGRLARKFAAVGRVRTDVDRFVGVEFLVERVRERGLDEVTVPIAAEQFVRLLLVLLRQSGERLHRHGCIEKQWRKILDICVKCVE